LGVWFAENAANSFMRKSLQNQWFIAFIGTAICLVAIVTGLAWWVAIRQTREEVEHRLRGIASVLSSPNFPMNTPILETISLLADTDVVLLDTQGRVIHTTDDSILLGNAYIPKAELPASEMPLLMHDLKLATKKPFHAAWIRYHPNVKEVESEDTPRWLGILVRAESVRETQRQAATLPLITGAATAIGLGLVAWALSARTVQRVRDVEDQVRRIAQGEYETILLGGPNDELWNLASSVNHMANELQSLERRIHATERERLVHQLASGLAHDLRNTLTGARLAVQWHAKTCKSGDLEATDVATRQLRLAEDQLQRWMQVASDKHVESGHSNFGEVLEDVAGLAGPTAAHLHVKLEIPRHPDLDTLEIPGQELVRSAILNLIMNAIQAAGNRGEVRCLSAVENGTLDIQVMDNGPGPNAAVQDRMFEPFVTSKAEGVGMGLALVKQTADRFHGKVSWKREDGWTIFQLQIPIGEPAQLIARNA
jgi:signal transduction histidine kinase